MAVVLGAVAATSSASASVASFDAGERIATLIDRVAPDRDGAVAGWSGVVPGRSTAAGTLVTVADTSVFAPSSPTDPVRITAPGGAVLDVSLPAGVPLGAGRSTSDGTVVYRAMGAGGVDTAVQALRDGSVRVQTVIRGRDAAHEFSYRLGGGFRPVEAVDGTVAAVRVSDDGGFQVFTVDRAWARDATGSAVTTHYEIRGDDLVQVVTPGVGAVYPIVADPTWMWYSAAYGARFTKAETRHLASFGAVTGFCAALPGGLAIACAIAGAQWFLQAQLSANNNRCVFIAAVPAPLALQYLGSGCT